MRQTPIWLGQTWNPKKGRLGRPVSYRSDRHLTLFGPTGSGKGVSIEIPNLLMLKGLSVISIDPKGQNAAVTARWRRRVSKVLMLNPLDLLGLGSAGFNPLVALMRAPANRFFEYAAAIAEALIKIDGDTQPHFPQSARGLVQALIMWEVTLARRERRVPSLLNVRRMLTEAELIDPQTKRPIAGLRFHAAQMVAFGGPQIASLAGRFIETSRELASIIGTADTQTRWLLSDAMAADLEKDGVDFATFKDRATTCFVILPAELLETHAGSVWLRLIITCAFHSLYRRAGSGGLRTVFMLSEFAQLGKLDSVTSALAQGRGYGVQLAPIVLQDINQLRTIYGRDAANTFLGMSGATFAFAPNDGETAEWMSKRSGEIVELGMSASDDPHGPVRKTYQQRRRRIFPPDDLFNIPEFHGLVWFAGQSRAQPVYAPPYWKIPALAGRYDPDPYHAGSSGGAFRGSRLTRVALLAATLLMAGMALPDAKRLTPLSSYVAGVAPSISTLVASLSVLLPGEQHRQPARAAGGPGRP